MPQLSIPDRDGEAVAVRLMEGRTRVTTSMLSALIEKTANLGRNPCRCIRRLRYAPS